MPLSGFNVFIVEDEALLLMLAELTLQKLGANIVATASDLDDAVRKAENIEADVALLDINLSGEMSFPVAQTLVARNLPVVFITGYTNPNLPPDLAAIPILTKPYDDQRLGTTLLATIQAERTAN